MIPIEFDASTNLALSGGQSLVFHCHYYNCALQKALEDGLGAEAPAVLRDSAAEVVADHLRALRADRDAAATLEMAASAFAELGFGRLDLGGVSADGGEAVIEASHYAMGWMAVHGERTEPACYFPAGFVRAAVAVAHDLELSRVTVRESACYASGAARCRFAVEVG